MGSVNTMLKLLITEAAKSANQMPKELAALTRYLPMKISSDETGWSGSARISEKKRAEQAKMDRAWDKLMLTLRKKPWSKLSGERSGWDGQTDTGGNYSSDALRYVSPSGLIVCVSRHVSFSTGTKSWHLSATLKPA